MAKKAAFYQLAKVMYVFEGKTFREIVLCLGEKAVSKRTLLRWSTEGSWIEKRAQYLQADTTFRERMQKLRDVLLAKALETGDPQIVYALARLEAVNRPTATDLQADDPEIVKPTGMSQETIEQIRRAILGVQE